MMFPVAFILLPVEPSRLTYGVIDTLFPRDPAIGIDAPVRLRHLFLIHKRLSYPEVCDIMPHYLLRRFMRSYVLP